MYKSCSHVKPKEKKYLNITDIDIIKIKRGIKELAIFPKNSIINSHIPKKNLILFIKLINHIG